VKRLLSSLLLIIVCYSILYSQSDVTIPTTSKSESGGLHKAALVLEGGSLRSLYTSGVLDVFMENDMEFELVVGVSAGALNAGNYVAKNIGRSAKINILHSNDPKYFGFKLLFTTGSVFNFQYLFYSPMKDIYPYNEQNLINSKQRFLIGVTNISSGKEEYFERHNYDDMVHVLQASSSMPLFSKPVNIDGQEYLDGAVADPVGVYKALSEGYDKVVVILTRAQGQRKAEPSSVFRFLYKLYYKKYPNLLSLLNNEARKYNALIDDINQMEKDGKIFVIRPSHEVYIKTVERDARRLTSLYFLGRDDSRKELSRLLEYLNR